MASRDFRIAARIRNDINYHVPLFPTSDNLHALLQQAKDFSYTYNVQQQQKGVQDFLSTGNLHAVGVLHLLYQTVVSKYLVEQNHDFFSRLSPQIARNHASQDVLMFFAKEFPSPDLMKQQPTLPFFLEETARGFFIHQVMTENPAIIKAVKPLLSPPGIQFPPASQALTALMGAYTKSASRVGENEEDIYSFLSEPSRLFPDSLTDQITFIIEHWRDLLPKDLIIMLLRAIDVISEETKPRFHGGPQTSAVPDYSKNNWAGFHEHEAFSADSNWMPNVVMIAKSTLVWLDQLSKHYGYQITTLDQIPDCELDKLAEQGFTGLWLIGLWERSPASKKIKNLCGNPEAEASAYALKGYDIAVSIGGWKALKNLDERCRARRIRLASDMVPNHTGIDSDWIVHHPDYYVSTPHVPYPSYSFNGPDLSSDATIEIKIEDHYFDRTDAAVTFMRLDKRSHEIQYIFHGNDGTSMPWNDTAQLDFLNPQTREAVIQQIIHVARNFSIIRFDAAMTLARKHIQRLWYPKPGTGGDIPGRSGYGLTDEEFNQRIPNEFWREVVDRISRDAPDTLLLAEAFWMMEGYFVRTLGMHRVYNSAFMNMLKNQENQKYRETIKNTIAYDPEILKRFVNFMNNPDEETAVAQFGDGDRYFGVCTLLATMPGLPMFGHGQIEGFKEKYGMEYRRAYWEEKPDKRLIDEHRRRIFPLLNMRHLFSGSQHFQLFDMVDDGRVCESVFAYVNGNTSSRVFVLYNNQYEQVRGRVHTSAAKLERLPNGNRELITTTLAESLMLTVGGRRYTIWTEFPENLTYIFSSMTIFDEGFSTQLNGYQTKIFLNIREVEDFDGSYELLCNQLSGKGTYTFESDLRTIRLQPIFRAMDNFRSPHMLKITKTLFNGESTHQSNRKLTLLAGEAYARLTAEFEKMLPAARKAIGEPVQEVEPLSLIRQIQRTADCFTPVQKLDKLTAQRDKTFFSSLGTTMTELPLIFNTFLCLEPFIEQDSSLGKVCKTIEQLSLTQFFTNAAASFDIEQDQLNHVLRGSAFFAAPPSSVAEGIRANTVDAKTILSALLSDESIQSYIGANLYEGVLWYKKEAFQEMVVLVLLGTYMRHNDIDSDSIISLAVEWFQADLRSDYRIDRLIGNL